MHNSFAYHLTPGGFILEGRQALGCAVIPGGVGNTEQQLEAIAHYKPSGYVGTPDFLKILLDTAEKTGKDASSFKRALVGAALPGSLRDESASAVLRCCNAMPPPARRDRLQSEAREGMIVKRPSSSIVRPGTGDPVAEGEDGEVVVTSFNPDYPMVRLGTGDLSALLPRLALRRSNMRIKGWMGRATRPPRSGACSWIHEIAEVPPAVAGSSGCAWSSAAKPSQAP